MDDVETAMPLRKAAGAGILLLLAAGFGLALNVVPLPVRKPIRHDLPVPEGVTRVVLFAGFPGCRTICPATLGLLAGAYERAGTSAAGTRVLFVDLEGTVSPEAASAYADGFHPAFLVWQPAARDRDRLVRALRIYYAPALPEYGKAARHSGTVYLLVREQDRWYLRYRWAMPETAADAEALFSRLSAS